MKAKGENPSRPLRMLCFVSLPPPNTGQAVATRTFLDLVTDDIQIRTIDISAPGFLRERGVVAFCRRTLDLAAKYVVFARALGWRPDIAYFCIASSFLGHLRDLLAITMARPFAGRIVAHSHTSDLTSHWQRHPVMAAYYAHLVDTTVFVSARVAAGTLQEVGSDAEVVHNTIDLALEFSEEDFQLKLRARLTRKTLNVVFISNMVRSKGYEDCVKAVEILVRSQIAVQTTLAGAWPDDVLRASFEKSLVDRNLTSNVKIMGAVDDRGSIKRLLNDADVFVLPTYHPTEALPVSIIEALNAGTPVIATAHGGIPEMIEDGANGIFVPPRDPVAIARALMSLRDVQCWSVAARAARASYEQRFSRELGRRAFLRVLVG